MTGISQKVGNFSEQVWGDSMSVVNMTERLWVVPAGTRTVRLRIRRLGVRVAPGVLLRPEQAEHVSLRPIGTY